jgi:hypothetical protein
MKALLLIFLVACAKPAGGPLAHTFDNTRIASVALESKQAVTQAQQQHDLARLHHDKADEAYRDSEVEQEVAEYQAEHAVLVSQLVGRMHDKAQTSPDTAALARRTAGAKVEFMRARREWLGALSNSTFYEVYATQAKLELERARAAQTNNLTPAGFDLASFEQQLDQRDRAARAAVAETERRREAAGSRLTAWNVLERQFMQTSGMTSPSESERAVLEWKQTALSTTGPAQAANDGSARTSTGDTPAPAASPTAKP